MPEEGAVSELDISREELDAIERHMEMQAEDCPDGERDDSNDCLMCATFIQWLREAWPEEKLEELPPFLPRERTPMLKVHNDQADPMPFCDTCARLYMQSMSQLHRDRQAREGQEQTELKARVEQKLVTPKKRIVLPGQPEFRSAVP